MDYQLERFLQTSSNISTPTLINELPEEVTTDTKPVTWQTIVLIVFLASLSGLFSGLNLGLLGLDVKNLELLTKGPFNNEDELRDAKRAEKILPLRRRGNLLLCTILLGNVTVNSGLSILMGDLTSGLTGLILSTGIITIFGEITPQAVCSRYALFVGSNTTWVIYFFMFLTFPISFPISAILDKVLGEEVGNILSKNQMKRMFEMLETENVIKSSERKIIQAALELQEKTAMEVMTPIDEVYMLEINTQLNHAMLREIYSKGFSRIPIFEHSKDNIVGILMARDLILINPEKALITLKQMSSIIIRDVIAVEDKDKLEPLLGYFKKGLTHIGVVCTTIPGDGFKDPYKKVIGIVTLEDIIEEIIQEEIEDEYELLDEKN
jgi:metal transporter CNNM